MPRDKNSQPLADRIFNWSLLTCAPLVMFSFWNHLLVFNAVAHVMCFFALWITWMAGFWGILLWKKPDGELRRYLQSMPAYKRWLFVPLMLLVIYWLMRCMLIGSVTWILHQVSHHPAELEVRVVNKFRMYEGDRSFCRGSVELDGFGYFPSDQLCYLTHDDWQQIQPGSWLLIKGQQSLFGFSVDSYQLLPKQTSSGG